MRSHVRLLVSLFILVLSSANFLRAQAAPATAESKAFTAEYPGNRAGIFIQGADWMTMDGAMPSKTKAKGGVMASLSYGAVPAKIVAEYAGAHAQLRLEPGQPVICICHLISLPGTPVIVRLHPKKESRELDGGKMFVYPVVGNSKIADANQSNLIPVDVTQPENNVWLVRPRQPLPAGDYALMLGTQNVNIFPFTVVPAEGAPPVASRKQ